MNIVQKLPTSLRVILPLFLTIVLLNACGTDTGQDEEPITIGIINLTSALDPVIDGFKAGMEELGYTEGENVTYIYDGPVNNVPDLDAAAQKLVDANVDMIFSLSTPATLATKRVTAGTDIPIVFGTVTDPISTGVVEDLTHPGGNITGIKTGGSEPKELEWLQIIVPDLKNVFIPYNPDDASSINALNEVRATAETLDVEVVAVETPNPEAVLRALQDMPEDIDGVLLLPDSIVVSQIDEFIAVTLERKIPLAAINEARVKAGALLAFGFDHYESGRQAARLAQQVLDGSSPADLPVETAEFYLSINLHTANVIGVTIDDTTLNSARTIVR